MRLRRQFGYVVGRHVEVLDARLCRGCGLAVYRSMTNRTLVMGWWGMLAALTNPLHVARNLAAGRRLARLDPPHTPPSGDAPPASGPVNPPETLSHPLRDPATAPTLRAPGTRTDPLGPTAPLWQRSGPWVTAVLAITLLGLAVAAAVTAGT